MPIKIVSENCSNYRAFDDSLIDHSDESQLLFSYLEKRYDKIPEYINNIMIKNSHYENWVEYHNKYFGKQFSILGDSISTLDGYNPRGYNVFYKEDNCEKSGVKQMSDTWWGKLIDFFGGELLVNNSWSGSRVTKLPRKDSLFPSGCSDERTSALHINNVKPDVIIVYLGTNDWAYGAKTGNDTKILGEDFNELFDEAYDNMLKKLKYNYPQSEIWCCTLNKTFMSRKPSFVFPEKHGGIHIEEYNEIIRRIARWNNCRLIDLYDYNMAYDSIDGSHPNNMGMSTIATMVIRSIAGFDVDQFLDCEDGQHEYKVVEEYTGGTRYICSRCGKTEHKSNLPPIECQEDQHEYEMCGQDGHGDYYRCRKCRKEKFVYLWEGLTVEENKNRSSENEYVMLEPNITTVLYSNILRLTIESTGKTVQFQKDVVEVGRDQICDFLLEGKSTVARRQATFLYEKDMWFLRDNFSTNGTWINGAKLQPGKKYQLATNDEINFAMTEKVIFYKLDNNTQPTGDPDAKALAFLEAGMAAFAKADYKDDAALKVIVATLADAPLYFPVEIDIESMLGSVDPMKLKAGDVLQPTKDVRMRILTLGLENGVEIVPMFTSNDEANKGPNASVVRLYPQDYLPKLVQMDKPVLINPFNSNRFLLSKQLITEVLLPIVQSKVSPQSDSDEPPINEVFTGDNEKPEAQENEFVGKVLYERYSVLEQIPSGGFFKIYVIEDIKTNKKLLMKVCDKGQKGYTDNIREIILQEPKMMMKFNHPALPEIFDVIEDDRYILIIRNYFEGESLDIVIRNKGPQSAEKVVEWGKQLCDALSYLHNLTPLHIYRDMKPHNVALTPEGNLKLIDFGTMRMYDPQKSCDTTNLGTKGYAAPEQYGGLGQTDARTDIFGLGMTLCELVTGEDPKKREYVHRPIRQINPDLPKGLEYIISKCTEVDPKNRYQTCSELLDDLNNYMSLPKSKGFFGKFFGKK